MFIPLSYGDGADGLSASGKNQDDDRSIQIAQRDPPRFTVVFPFVQADDQWPRKDLGRI